MKVHRDEPVRQAAKANEADCELALASVTTPGKKSEKEIQIESS